MLRALTNAAKRRMSRRRILKSKEGTEEAFSSGGRLRDYEHAHRVQGPHRLCSHHPVLDRSQTQGQGLRHPDPQVREHQPQDRWFLVSTLPSVGARLLRLAEEENGEILPDCCPGSGLV